MTHKNGCWGRAPFDALIPIPAIYPIKIEGHIVMAEADEMSPYPFARECQYRLTELGKADKGCDGCVHKETK